VVTELADILEGYQMALSFIASNPTVIFTCLIGMLLGLVIGLLPGISGPSGVAILIPITFAMEPTVGIVMLVSLYCASTFGGAITAILFNIPGDPQNACTTFDGFPLAKQGKAGKALGTALAGGAAAGLLGTIILSLVAPPLAKVGLAFGPAEYFGLAIMGISVISSLEAASIWKNLTSGLLGLLIATIGIDPLTAYGRFTFGFSPLLQGIDFIIVVIGTFAITEVLCELEEKEEVKTTEIEATKVSIEFPSLKEWLAMKWDWLRSTAIGYFVGILPGIGATTASFVSYSQAINFSKHPENFGKGELTGVLASEAAGNAGAAGAMVPLLSLGIPGSATAAILIGALTIHGIQPGPLMMTEQKAMAFTIFLSMFITFLLIIGVGIWLVRFFAKIMEVDYSILGPIVIILCIIGVFTVRNSIYDVILALFFGVLGYFMRKFKYPTAPLIIGVVLGPLAEINFRRAFIISNYNIWAVFSRPIVAVLLLFSLGSMIYGFWSSYKREQSKAKAGS